MFAEYQWMSSVHGRMSDFGTLWTATRYVDNRLRISLTGPVFRQHPELQAAQHRMQSLHRVQYGLVELPYLICI